MGNEGLIDRVLQQDRIHILSAEHVDVLALLGLVRHIINDGPVIFFFVLFAGIVRIFLCLFTDDLTFHMLRLIAAVFSGLLVRRYLRTLFSLFFTGLGLQILLQRQELAVQIFIEDEIHHSVGEFLVLQAAELDERADIVPVFFIVLPVGLVHAGKLVCDLLGNVSGNLLHKSVVLQRASGDIQRQIRTVDHTLQQHQVFGDDFFDIIRDEDLVVVQFDLAFNGVILCVDPREVQDSFQVKRVIHVQMDPEQRLLVIQEHVPVEFFILLFRALRRLFGPQRMCVADADRTASDLHLLLVVFFDVFKDNIIVAQVSLVDRLFAGIRILFGEENLHRHEGAVFFEHFAHAVLIGKLQTLLIQMQCDRRARFRAVSGPHHILRAAVTLPVYRLRALPEAQRIDINLLGNHKGRIESQSEMSDNLVFVCFVFVFLQKFRGAGKSDLRNIFDNFLRRHADSVIDELQGLALVVHDHFDLRLIPFGQMCLADRIQFFALGDGIGAV